jgi:hypothetical protein
VKQDMKLVDLLCNFGDLKKVTSCSNLLTLISDAQQVGGVDENQIASCLVRAFEFHGLAHCLISHFIKRDVEAAGKLGTNHTGTNYNYIFFFFLEKRKYQNVFGEHKNYH